MALNLGETWDLAFRERDRRPMYEWAYDNVKLCSPIAKTGPFDVSESRHFIDVFAALQDERTRQVNVLASPRSGKTLIADVWSLWIPPNQPGPILWVFQEDKAAKDQAELRTWRFIELCEAVRRLLPSDRHAARTKEINFPHMPFHIVGPADSNLQSRGWQNVILDEVWMYKRGKVEEARGRLGDFVKQERDKLFLLSQGGDTDSDWDIEFSKALIFDWNVQCASCDHYMMPKFRGFRPDGTRWGFVFDSHKDDRGRFIESKVIPTVRFECEKCSHPHIWSARTKGEWNRTGKYIAEANPDKRTTRKSFRWNALIDFPWQELAALYIGALNALKTGNPIPLIKFLQKSGGEMASERTVLEGGQLFARVETQSSEWEFADERLAAVDVQEDHFWMEVRDFSRRLGGESRRVWFGKLYSYVDIDGKREEFKVTPERLMIDSGYNAKGEKGVYAACVRYGWTAVKGVGTVSGERKQSFWHSVRLPNGEAIRSQKSYAPLAAGDPEIGTSRQGAAGLAKLIRFSADDLADRLDSLIDSDLYKEPIVDESDPLEAERKRHFSAEFKKEKVDKFSGQKTYVRVCPSGNNHSYDLGKMLILGAVLCDVIPDPYDEMQKVAA